VTPFAFKLGRMVNNRQIVEVCIFKPLYNRSVFTLGCCGHFLGGAKNQKHENHNMKNCQDPKALTLGVAMVKTSNSC